MPALIYRYLKRHTVKAARGEHEPLAKHWSRQVEALPREVPGGTSKLDTCAVHESAVLLLRGAVHYSATMLRRSMARATTELGNAVPQLMHTLDGFDR